MATATYLTIGVILAIIYLVIEIKWLKSFEYEGEWAGVCVVLIIAFWPMIFPLAAIGGVIWVTGLIADRLY